MFILYEFQIFVSSVFHSLLTDWEKKYLAKTYAKRLTVECS